MPRCLVTGGAGFIGSHIVEALVGRGDRVRVLDNLSTGHLRNLEPFFDDIEFVEGDLTQLADVQASLRDIEIVFHQAALASVPRSIENPLETHHACVTGTLQLLDEARKANVKRFVYAASSSAYGDQPFSSKRECDSTIPLSPYAAAKLAGEGYCQAFYHSYGLETVGLRYFNVFGPRQDPDSPYSAVIPLFITRILSGKSPIVYGDGQQSRDFTFVANVVHGNLLASVADNSAVGRILNMAMGNSISLLELISQLNRLLKLDVQPVFEPPRIGDVRDSLADITLARKYLGFEPQVGFRQGLEQSIDYYRSVDSQ